MIRPCCVILAVLGLAWVALAPAAEPGLTPLFDGSTLSGWRYGKDMLAGKTATSDGHFAVSGGSIVMSKDKTGKKEGYELTSTREFAKDFILRLEFKSAEEAMGSLSVRNLSVPVGDFVRRGVQSLRYFKNDGWNEMELEVKMTASVPNRRLNDSDQLSIKYHNGKAIVTVNGSPIDPNPAVIHTLLYVRCNGESLIHHQGRNIASRGDFGLRTGSGKIEFRNIRFRELQ